MKLATEATGWAISQLPLDWVVEHEKKLWIVPAAVNGWNRKRPYKGCHPDKIPSSSKAEDYMLMSVGVPFSLQ